MVFPLCTCFWLIITSTPASKKCYETWSLTIPSFRELLRSRTAWAIVVVVPNMVFLTSPLIRTATAGECLGRRKAQRWRHLPIRRHAVGNLRGGCWQSPLQRRTVVQRSLVELQVEPRPQSLWSLGVERNRSLRGTYRDFVILLSPGSLNIIVSSYFNVCREDVPSSASRVDSLEMLAWVTPRFVGSLCGMLRNLVCVAPDTVLNEVKEEDILGFILR